MLCSIIYAADEHGLGIGFSNQHHAKLFSQRAGYSGPSRLIHFHRFLLRFLCWYQPIIPIRCLINKIISLLSYTNLEPKLNLPPISYNYLWFMNDTRNIRYYQLDIGYYRRRMSLGTLHFPWYLDGAISMYQDNCESKWNILGMKYWTGDNQWKWGRF